MRALALLILCVAAASAASQQRIVGGSMTTINQYPSMAAILYTEDFSYFTQTCAGVIITEKAILTATQCFEDDPAPTKWLVRLGSTFASSGGQLFNAERIVTHPAYNTFTKNNDIAIFRVAGFIVYTTGINFANIAGPNYILPEGELVKATGWGQTSYLGRPAEQLREVDVSIFNQDSCRRRYLLTGKFVTEDKICVGWNGGGRGQCIGDLGGPIYHSNNVVLGVYSFSNFCGLGTFPSVNTRVNHYLDFIIANSGDS